MAVRRRKDIVLVGARGQAKDLIGCLEDDGRFRIVCLLDEIAETRLLGHAVVRPEAYDGGCRDALLAIGLPEAKVKVLAQYERFAFRWQSFVDRRSFVSPHAELGEGCIVAPFATLSGDVRVGAHVYVAAYAGAGHDSVIGDLCSLLPYSGLGGGSRIGVRCTLGAGAHLLPGITIGDDVMVAGSATVTRDLPDRVTAFGTPARTMARV
jgi:sugar O-acyltransferase (sialic acid O-acetyltransferase NeuD family)